jgi:hypothetical protein
MIVLYAKLNAGEVCIDLISKLGGSTYECRKPRYARIQREYMK